jgi:hypothetical protein
MAISELGSLGEFLSSIAVLITLIFLVVQLRQNAKLMSRANVRHANDANSRALAALLDEGVSELFIKGLKSLESLTEVERYRFDNALANWLYACEEAFTDQRDGMFPDDQFVKYANSVPGYLATPGGKLWCEQSQTWFGPAFRKDVDQLCANLEIEATKSGPKLRDR